MQFVFLDQKNIFFIAIGSLILFLFGLLSIYPNQRSLKILDNEIADYQLQIKAQKILFPLYGNLLKNTAALRIDEKLPSPARAGIKQNELNKITKNISRVAAQHDFTVNLITPDINTLIDESNYFKVAVSLTGNFMALRQLFIALYKLPYLENFTKIKIKSINQDKLITFTLLVIKE